MNTLHAGLMCTVLLTGTIASLFGCMSAVRCHRRFAFAICLTIASLDFAALAILLSRLPGSETLAPVPWTAAALSLTALSHKEIFVELSFLNTVVALSCLLCTKLQTVFRILFAALSMLSGSIAATLK